MHTYAENRPTFFFLAMTAHTQTLLLRETWTKEVVNLRIKDCIYTTSAVKAAEEKSDIFYDRL